MKKILYSVLALAMTAFTLTSCEDVPEPYTQPAEVEAINPTGNGTLEEPFNIAAVNQFIKAGVGLDQNVYIKGIVSTIDEISVSNGNATFYISDNGTILNQFYVYRCKGLNNENVASEDIIKLGDEVIIYGKVVNYNGTYETSQGAAYIYSINGNGGNSGSTGDDEPPVGTNLLANGDFEVWTDNLPDNWKTESSAGNATLTQSTDAHGGIYSVCVGGATSANKRLGYKEITLKAGTYNISFYAKAATSNGACVDPGYVPVTDGSVGSYIYAKKYVDVTDAEWTQVTHNFTLDSDTTISLVIMNSKSPGGDVLIDDYVLYTSDGGISDGNGGSTGGEQPSGEGYAKVTKFTAGNYIIAANTDAANYVVASPLSSTYTYGYLLISNATESNGLLSTTASNEFTFESTTGGYTIKDADGRYYYMDGTFNSFNVSTSLPASGYVWTVTFNEDGTANIKNTDKGKTLQYSSSHTSFGAYSNVDLVLPYLFKK